MVRGVMKKRRTKRRTVRRRSYRYPARTIVQRRAGSVEVKRKSADYVSQACNCWNAASLSDDINSTSSWTAIHTATAIGEGVGSQQRIGQKVYVKGVMVKLHFSFTSDTTFTFIRIRVLIFSEKHALTGSGVIQRFWRDQLPIPPSLKRPNPEEVKVYFDKSYTTRKIYVGLGDTSDPTLVVKKWIKMNRTITYKPGSVLPTKNTDFLKVGYFVEAFKDYTSVAATKLAQVKPYTETFFTDL